MGDGKGLYPVDVPDLLADELRLPPILAAKRILGGVGKGGFAGQAQLRIKNYSACARHMAGTGGMETDAAMHPDRLRKRRFKFLQKHEGGLIANPASGLIAFGDKTINATLLAG